MRVDGSDAREASAAEALSKEQGSIQFVRLPALPGVEVMEVRHVSRKWAYFHETYSLCVASWVEDGREVPWRYRQRTYQMTGTGVQLMEPGEFHANLRPAPPADFRVLLLAPEMVRRVWSELSGRDQVVHFCQAQLNGGPVRDALIALAGSVVDSRDAELAEHRLYGAFATLAEHRCLDAAAPSKLVRRTQRGVRTARDLIHDAWNQHLPLAAISGAAGMPIATLERAFHVAYGTSPRQYQIHLRLMRGKELLRRGEAPVLDAAEACGFRDPKYFSRLFKREFGCPPSAYRRAP